MEPITTCSLPAASQCSGDLVPTYRIWGWPREPVTGQGRLRPRIRLIPRFTQFGLGSFPSNSSNILTRTITTSGRRSCIKNRRNSVFAQLCSCSPSSSSPLSLTLASLFLNDLVSPVLFYSIDLVSFIRIPLYLPAFYEIPSLSQQNINKPPKWSRSASSPSSSVRPCPQWRAPSL